MLEGSQKTALWMCVKQQTFFPLPPFVLVGVFRHSDICRNKHTQVWMTTLCWFPIGHEPTKTVLMMPFFEKTSQFKLMKHTKISANCNFASLHRAVLFTSTPFTNTFYF
jgi:hypothetical protein